MENLITKQMVLVSQTDHVDYEYHHQECIILDFKELETTRFRLFNVRHRDTLTKKEIRKLLIKKILILEMTDWDEDIQFEFSIIEVFLSGKNVFVDADNLVNKGCLVKKTEGNRIIKNDIL